MTPFHIGSLCYPYQTVDVVGPLDVLSSAGQECFGICQTYSPTFSKELASQVPEFVYHHIGLTLDPVSLTGGFVATPTTTVEDCPELDCLLLGGPAPHLYQVDPRYADFIRRHVAKGKLLWANCTGAYVAASAGVLDGKRATVNHVELAWVKQHYPKVNWTMDAKWVVDGNIWTAAGASRGMDMAAHWVKKTYGEEIFNLATLSLDFEPKEADGVTDTIAKRYDADGVQLPTHVFVHYPSY